MVVKLMVVDDGALPTELIEGARRDTEHAGLRFEYVRKQPAERGLFNSRLEVLRRCSTEVVLFLDDDVEVAPDYLAVLHRRYAERPDLAGLGGVNELAPLASRRWLIFSRLFLLRSSARGRLSLAGFPWSQHDWPQQRHTFESEYLSGSNMSFRVHTLQEVSPVAWLEGYSLGEDLYLSAAARRHGQLHVDPALRVRHHFEEVGRPDDVLLAESIVLNHYRLAQRNHPALTRKAAVVWAAIGLCLQAAKNSRLNQCRGYVRGIFKVFLGTAREGLAAAGPNDRLSPSARTGFRP
jgi:hypothetical protein